MYSEQHSDPESDNSAAPLYWSQLEAALAVVSACLTTLRPLFHGLSPESVLGSFRTKVSRHLKIPGSSQSSMRRFEPDEQDLSSLAELTHPSGKVGTYIESKGEGKMMELEEVNGGIKVHQEVRSQSERV